MCKAEWSGDSPSLIHSLDKEDPVMQRASGLGSSSEFGGPVDSSFGYIPSVEEVVGLVCLPHIDAIAAVCSYPWGTSDLMLGMPETTTCEPRIESRDSCLDAEE